MSELNPGDRVFVGPWVLIDDGEAYELRGEGHFIGDVLMAPPDKDAAPYTDNLAAVARVLAAHGDALMNAVTKALDSAKYWVEIQDKWAAQLVEMEFGKPDLDVIPQESRDLVAKSYAESVAQRDALRALAAALNGGTE